MKTFTLRLPLLIAGMSLFLQSCAPVFSELQSARTVGKNRFEVTPSGSYVTVSSTDEGTEGVQSHLGVQGAYGISAKVDLRFRYEHLWPLGDDEGIGIVGFGPKFSLVEDKIAFYLPIGRAVGENTGRTWQMHPTLLLTLPIVQNKIELTVSPKYLVSFCEGCENLVAANAGLAISTDVTRWAIRPEYGLLYNPGESGHFSHFSLGFSLGFGK